MEGMIILSESITYCYPEWVFTATICGTIIVVYNLITISRKKILNLFIGFLALIIVICTIIYANENPQSDGIEYKVIFEEKIDINELLENYSIISTDGKILTIKEKNKDE